MTAIAKRTRGNRYNVQTDAIVVGLTYAVPGGIGYRVVRILADVGDVWVISHKLDGTYTGNQTRHCLTAVESVK
jgi:hypothetical protein